MKRKPKTTGEDINTMQRKTLYLHPFCHFTVTSIQKMDLFPYSHHQEMGEESHCEEDTLVNLEELQHH